MTEHNGTVTIKTQTIWQIATFVLAVLFIISLATGGFGIGGNSNGNVILEPDNNGGVTEEVGVNIEDNDPVLGNADAEISIVEFSDFQCPFCERAFSGAIAEFKNSNYFKNGQVNLIFKHFPLNSIHPQAQKAAEAAECARKQGKFWEMHDKLFQNQGSLDISSLKTYAQQIGLNTANFNSCLDNNEAKNEVSKETQQAVNSGGLGTPYFILVNRNTGKTTAVSGALPWSNFEAAINSLI